MGTQSVGDHRSDPRWSSPRHPSGGSVRARPPRGVRAASLAVALLATIVCNDPSRTASPDGLRPGGPRRAAAALNAVTTASAVDATTLSLPHTTSGANRHLVVAVHHAGEGARTLNAVTYGGAPLTRLASVTYGPRVTELWHLVAPPLGANQVVATFAGSARYLIV